MNQNEKPELVDQIMRDFASLTGLEPVSTRPKRYLWTDAFAVCNFLELYRVTQEPIHQDLALHLIDQVHHSLGKHRIDDVRKGWISGLNENEGEKHPTRGGLRIGKTLNERQPGEPYDERLEWDQDGQYYHYLTKWMHALHNATISTGDPVYNKWAMELARTAHNSFTYNPTSSGRKRMYWKMSIDLSHPLVPSTGQHDPLDGFITYNELQMTAQKLNSPSAGLETDLWNEIHDMAHICRGLGWTTNDPLGIGGLLSDALRIAQLVVQGDLRYLNLLENVLESALFGVESFAEQDLLKLPADYRLAFRELGLSIGLKGIEKLNLWIKENSKPFGTNDSLKPLLEALMKYVPLSDVIEKFWMDETNRKSSTWTEHQEINMVMLATSLDPDGFLLI